MNLSTGTVDAVFTGTEGTRRLKEYMGEKGEKYGKKAVMVEKVRAWLEEEEGKDRI